ncbi:MAG: tyrosine-type recombinase/integrase [Clostridiales bacterium]|nr:tyrosine-type recombinase/integrase [Clostridiales bacterium]
MKKDRLAETTIKVTDRRLRMMDRVVNLDEPEKVIEYLATKDGKNSYIEGLVDSYDRYVRYNGLKWNKPRIRRSSQPPYVPTIEEVTILISDAGKKYSLILSILRDTGMRPIELQRAKLRWFDLKRGIINVQTAKYGNPRTLHLKSQTLAMLKEYLGNHDFCLDDNIFPKVRTMRTSFQRLRQRTSDKLQRPELKKISMYSFRHFFATQLYYKTKDILLVKKKLGHKRLENTLIYTHLINFRDEEFTVRTASNVLEASKLIEVGFEYVTEMDGLKIFKKPK